MKLLVLLLTPLLAGCTYYKVHDLQSHREYVTDNWKSKEYKRTGAFRLQDLRTGKKVVLQSYELEKISKREAMELRQAPAEAVDGR